MFANKIGKIFLDKHDTLEVAVDKVLNHPTGEVTLNIPKESLVSNSINNFRILRREAATVEKKLLIESVDDRVLELSELAGIDARNPVLGGAREKIFSDIVPAARIPRGDSRRSPESIRSESRATPEVTSDNPPRDYVAAADAEAERVSKRIDFEERKFPRFKMTLVLVVILALGFLGYDIAQNRLPSAAVSISLEKTEFLLEERVVIDVKNKEVDLELPGGIGLPGELLIARRNLEIAFPASGKKIVEKKAKGKLVVVNAFSSSPQTIVATTRFESPEGKIFRLDSQVTIPGARVEAGRITPSEIKVSVTADQAGEDYNVGASDGWRVPGFKGTPRYDGFFARAEGPMTGGFVGELKVPTEDDISAARELMTKALKDALEAQMFVLLVHRFEVADEAKDFRILSEKVSESADENDNFSVFMEGSARYIVYERGVLEEALISKGANSLGGGVKVKEMSFGKEDFEVDLENGRLEFTARGRMLFETDVDINAFKKEILGSRDENLRTKILSLQGLEYANVSLWPFWVKRVPENPERVEIKVEE